MSLKKLKVKIPLDEKIALCEVFTKKWADFFNFFGDEFEGRKITGENEAQFFRAMTDLAREQFRLTYFLGGDLSVGEQITTILSEAVSLMHIHDMSEAQFASFQLKWHQVFIALNKCLGRLIERQSVTKATKAKGGLPALSGLLKKSQPNTEKPAAGTGAPPETK